jgi:hypothetical protein
MNALYALLTVSILAVLYRALRPASERDRRIARLRRQWERERYDVNPALKRR